MLPLYRCAALLLLFVSESYAQPQASLERIIEAAGTACGGTVSNTTAFSGKVAGGILRGLKAGDVTLDGAAKIVENTVMEELARSGSLAVDLHKSVSACISSVVRAALMNDPQTARGLGIETQLGEDIFEGRDYSVQILGCEDRDRGLVCEFRMKASQTINFRLESNTSGAFDADGRFYPSSQVEVGGRVGARRSGNDFFQINRGIDTKIVFLYEGINKADLSHLLFAPHRNAELVINKVMELIE